MKRAVPYLRESEIEAEAELLLAEFARDRRPVLAPPVPIDEIIELHLNLSFEIRDLRSLFGFGDIHGAIWFRDKLIAVDQQLDPDLHPAKLGRFHFTLAHETAHWRLHRKHYVQAEGQGDLFAGAVAMPNYICRSIEKKHPVEWQADNFASKLLMPKSLIRQEWEKWHGSLDSIVLTELTDRSDRLRAELIRRGGNAGADESDLILENVSRPLAQAFQVSAEAMRIRLEDHSFLLRKRESSLF